MIVSRHQESVFIIAAFTNNIFHSIWNDS